MGSPHLEEKRIGGNVVLDLLFKSPQEWARIMGGIERKGKFFKWINGGERSRRTSAAQGGRKAYLKSRGKYGCWGKKTRKTARKTGRKSGPAGGRAGAPDGAPGSLVPGPVHRTGHRAAWWESPCHRTGHRTSPAETGSGTGTRPGGFCSGPVAPGIWSGIDRASW